MKICSGSNSSHYKPTMGYVEADGRNVNVEGLCSYCHKYIKVNKQSQQLIKHEVEE